MTGRCCVVCGESLQGRRAHAVVCGPACRREASRIRRLLSGETVDGYRCWRDYESRGERRQKACETTDKLRGVPVSRAAATRTDRARGFVLDRCAERPGHRTTARYAYGAYLRWCVAGEPQAPLSYTPFVVVLDDWSPHEGRAFQRRPGSRGRSALVFLGIVVRSEA